MTVDTNQLDDQLPVDDGYPDDAGEKQQIARRQRNGANWLRVFILATMVGIIALAALIYNIVNSAFGYVAVQNQVDPEAVVLQVEEERMMAASNLTATEDDAALASAIATDPYAIGFFGYAFYQEQADNLKILTVDGVSPSIESVESGEYPYARPLFIYTAADVLEEKPQVADFVDFYLNNVNDEITDVGYFPARAETISAGVEAWKEATADIGDAASPSAADTIATAGSSTVFPLTQRMADRYGEAGNSTAITVESIGSKVGLARFCNGGSKVDMANASRTMNRAERAACQDAKRTPLEFRVGTDAIAVVVSRQNDFLTEVTAEQLRLIFTEAETWSDVDPAWPNQPIMRYTPSLDSGTLDFFVEQTFNRRLQDLPKETLATILEQNVSAGLMRRFENDMPMAERTQADVLALVNERVIEPETVQAWSLWDSIFKRTEIEAAAAEVENGVLSFRSWITMDFLTSPQSSKPDQAGIRTAILGSLWVIFITLIFSLPLGVGAAIYLEEYASDNWFNRLIETNINNLAGVPSIIYGMLGLAIFVRVLEAFTSGAFFGGVEDPTTANGRTVLSAGLTLGLLILPIIIINAREAVRAVPHSLRQASYGLGATKWQTIWNHVLPSALPGILTGNILAMSRAIGETAPLVVIGASTFIVVDPNGPFAKFTTLPIQIYQWTARPQAEFRNIAAAAIIVLLVLLLSLNASAILLRNRYSSERA